MNNQPKDGAHRNGGAFTIATKNGRAVIFFDQQVYSSVKRRYVNGFIEAMSVEQFIDYIREEAEATVRRSCFPTEAA